MHTNSSAVWSVVIAPRQLWTLSPKRTNEFLKLRRGRFPNNPDHDKLPPVGARDRECDDKGSPTSTATPCMWSNATLPCSPDALTYEATIEDPKVFARPWKISMPLYRRLEKNAQLLEFKCVEFVEELMYGHLRKQPSN